MPSGVFDLREAESYSTVRRASRSEKTPLARPSHHWSSREVQNAVRLGVFVVEGEKAYLRYVERANRESAEDHGVLGLVVDLW